MPRAFDFKALLDQHRIEYVTRGKNVARGEINIQCPFCGTADPSHHMGINLETGWWSCWRNRTAHSGKSPLRLIVALLRVPYWQARQLAGYDRDYIDPDGFSTVAQRLRDGWGKTSAEVEPPPPLEFPREFRPLDNSYAMRHHLDYLEFDRGFAARDVLNVCEDYNLQGATRGRFTSRIILPYYMDGQLVTWTGRAIGKAEIRYLDLSVDDSVLPAKHTLYNYDAVIDGGVMLVVVEGPMDALKLDYYGRPYGVRAVALSTNSMQDDQAYMIAEAAERFEQFGVMMDNASQLSIVDSVRMRDALAFAGLPVRALRPPGGAKDAAAATPDDLIDFAKEHGR